MKRSSNVRGTAAFLALAALSSSPAAAQPAGTTEASRRALEDYARLLMIERNVIEAMGRHFDANLIQHDAEIGDGGHGDEQFLTNRRQQHPEQFLSEEEYHTVVDNLLADGDVIALKSHVYTNPKDPGRVFVDIWRVAAGGKFVEHWDVIQPVPSAPLNDATMWCGGASDYDEADKVGDTVAQPGCGHSGPAAHRQDALAAVTAYTTMSQDPLQCAAAVERYFAEDFVQHSPYVAQGKGALVAYEREQAQPRLASGRKSQTARVIADGDLVMTHRRVTTSADPRGAAHLDLYRVRDGKIVEHWDVIQPIPPFSVAGHSMVDGPLEPGRTVGRPGETAK